MPAENELIEELLTIPHLKLNYDFDLSQVLKEFEQDFPLVPYDIGPDHRYQKLRAKYLETWSAVSLIDYEGDTAKGATSVHDVDDPGEQAVTDVGKKCPYTVALVRKFQNEVLNRSRFCRIAPNSNMIYHSHIRDHGAPRTELIVNIPLIMPDNFVYSVTPDDNLVRDEDTGEYLVKNDSITVHKRYRAGEIHLLNAYFYHTVWNNSDSERIALVFYADIRDNDFLRNLAAGALQSYDGPRLKPD